MGENGRSDETARIEPGQIWLIETPLRAGLAALDRDVLSHADAVLYDCALAPHIADVLVAGGYTEPLSAETESAAPAISARALKLASEGWSVVQLVQPCHQWRRRLRGIAEELGQSSLTRSLAIRLITKAAGDRFQFGDERVCDLPELVDGAGEDEPLAVIVGPLDGGASAAAYAFAAANGLAG